MVAPSKLLLDKETVGFFYPVSYSCYEWVHNWEPSCYVASFGLLKKSLKFSLKVYSTFYLLSFLLNIRKNKNLNIKTFKKLIRNILRSSIFLSLNGTLFLSYVCVNRFLQGNFHAWSGFLAGALAGYTCINLERKSRRTTLALYLANLGCETLFNIALSRNLVSVVPYAKVYMFIVASTGLMTLFRMSPGLSEDLRKQLRLLVGSSEEKPFINQPLTTSHKRESNFILELVKIVGDRLRHCHRSHKSCPHSYSCLYYLTKGFFRNFSMGYSIQAVLNLLQFVRKPQSIDKFISSFAQLKTCSLGLFLGLYNGLFCLSNCTLRWLFNADLPVLFGAISGAVAGASAYFYQSTTIAMYFLFKLFEILGSKAIDRGWFPRIPYLYMHVYAISLGIILQAAYLEPHNIRPTYWKFICGVSGNVLPLLFRKLYDVYGVNSSQLYPNFYPDLDPKYVTSLHVIEIMKAAGKW